MVYVERPGPRGHDEAVERDYHAPTAVVQAGVPASRYGASPMHRVT